MSSVRYRVVRRSWWYRGTVHTSRAIYCTVDGERWIQLGPSI
ncbi:hypothetical protein [Streptomyces sp. BH105]